jgi:glycosyltransferase involved in cell wall biosynthesis
MKILWGSPLPPTRSGVSDYALDLLGELGSIAKVRVLEPPGGLQRDTWTFGNGVEVVPTLTPAEDDEVCLIHLGNNRHHSWLLDRLESPNTVVVLHDLVLHHLLVETTEPDDLETRLGAAHGEAGTAIARGRRYGLSRSRDPFFFPARAAFLQSAAGIVVHSRWAEKVVKKEFPNRPVGRVELAVADPGPVLQSAERGRLGIGPDDVVLMHLGFLTPEKGLEHIIGGVTAAHRAGIPARLVLVGEGDRAAEVHEAASAVGAERLVSATGWVEPELFPAVPAAADLGVVMRTPSAGETSAAAIRFLAAGTPVAVCGLRQFLEWPEEAAPRLTPGASAAAELARLLALVHADGGAWKKRGEAARSVYEERHRPAAIAADLIQFLEKVSERQAGSHSEVV